MSRLSLGKAQQEYDSRVPESVDADQECERCGVQSFSDDGELCVVAIPDEGSTGAEDTGTSHVEICQDCLDALHAWFCPGVSRRASDALIDSFGVKRGLCENMADLTDDQIVEIWGADTLADLKAQIEIDNERAER